MTFDEFLQSPYLKVIGDSMLAASKQKTERKYVELNQTAEKGGTVIFGDSIVEYFPVWELFDEKIYNRGIGGDTSEETLSRLEKIVCPLAPEKAILWVGTNDLNARLTLSQTLENVKSICDTLQKNYKTQIYIMSVAPVDILSKDNQTKMTVSVRDNEKISQINSEYQKLCIDNGWTYINVYDELLLNGSLNPVFTVDGLHLSIAGYNPVVEILKEKVLNEN